mmetsp:Transcript_13367/g.14993  ORF Transcript_13367/g.14993 Transcript_13367/m.14993 type:complete len:231 (-) Transcript_13367:21-713(-)
MSYTEEKKGSDIYLSPVGSHTHTLIWCHGLGDTAAGFYDVFSNADNTIVHASTKVILLTAPTRAVTINMGMEMPAWYDYKKIAFQSLDECIELDQLQESKERINQVIEEEVALLGGDHKKIILGGFSQGAATILYTALEHSHDVGAVVSFSGHQLYEKIEDINTEKKSLPIFAYHGELDPVLNFQMAFPFFEGLKEEGFKVEHHSEKSLAHSLSLKELTLAKLFLIDALS